MNYTLPFPTKNYFILFYLNVELNDNISCTYLSYRYEYVLICIYVLLTSYLTNIKCFFSNIKISVGHLNKAFNGFLF